MRSILATGVALALAIMLAGCSSTPSAATPGATATAGTGGSGSAVTIQDFAFKPADLSVKVGTTVTWTNKDSAGHSVKWDDGTTPSSNLANGQTYPRTFDAAGTFTYICGVHGASMSGKVTVTP